MKSSEANKTLYEIHSECLSAKLDPFGAQLISLRSAAGTEYLWQRDAAYWQDASPLLFPWIGRFFGGGYTLHGRKYEMGIHGFAADSHFSAESCGSDCVTFVLQENEDTLRQYPFRFSLAVTYRLEGAALKVKYTVRNRDSRNMPFAIGGHPGFCVPMGEGTEFSDYYIEFGEPCMPDRIGFTDHLLLSGERIPYPLENGRILRLNHALFDKDAIVLENMARCLTLKCSKNGRSVTVRYPDMPFVGFWHKPMSDAPYVCIEPWSSLPARQDVIEEISCRSDLLVLAPGEVYETQWEASVTEK